MLTASGRAQNLTIVSGGGRRRGLYWIDLPTLYLKAYFFLVSVCSFSGDIPDEGASGDSFRSTDTAASDSSMTHR